MVSQEDIAKCKDEFKAESMQWQNKYHDLEQEVMKLRANYVQENDKNACNQPNLVSIDRIVNECKEARNGLEVMEEKWSQCLEIWSEKILAQDQYSKKK